MDGRSRRIDVDVFDKHGARMRGPGRMGYSISVVECVDCGTLLRRADDDTQQRAIFDAHDRLHALVDRAEPIIGRPTLADAQAWAAQFPEVPHETRSGLSAPTRLDRVRGWLDRFSIR